MDDTPLRRAHSLPTGFRLRGSAGLVSLPWHLPLREWDAAEVPLKDVPVGPSRHLVRFVEVEGRVYALKELPARLARREYEVLRELEGLDLPAVRPVGLVEHAGEDAAVLVTLFLERSWQYRRLFMQLPPNSKHRERLLDAMAALLVELHRCGIFWGDCSLANTLFTRSGQTLQAYLVDAETSEVHPSLSDGQRSFDLSILVENVAAGLMDVAARLELSEGETDELVDAALSVSDRYRSLWAEVHREEVLSFEERSSVVDSVRRLNDLGFHVDEVTLEPTDETGVLRLRTLVAGRTFHAARFRSLTGLSVLEGQARILLSAFDAYRSSLAGEDGTVPPEHVAGRLWVQGALRPGMDAAQAALGFEVDPVQAYCDLLEVRWLLSEEAGFDVGDHAALSALTGRAAPLDSAAKAVVAELPAPGVDESLFLVPVSGS